ncbi:AraC family transcriptional regulator [Paenibacillus aurantius]|uniref:AraC family transcriptional regulator n=1 Tax=Paenibacillus aurantius TaxID=2918900 RepID=A0AA96LB82_9BACL|nr:AraC family transcriptional regulator [Paenibacillus aurantius]WNQ10704.1 AraC family transcriptional regulator [Paenibacillus aurantius]
MHPSAQLLTDALRVRFLHINQYRLDSAWKISQRKLEPTVLWYISEGCCHLSVDGHPYIGEAGDILVIPGGSILSSRTLSTTAVVVSVNLEADISFLSQRSWALLLHVPVKPMLNSSELVTLFNRMLRTYESPTAGQALLLQADLLRMMGILLDQSHSDDLDGSTPLVTCTDPRIRSVIEYLIRNPARQPSLTELAELAGVSESHLRKLFVRETGLAPLSFVQRLKIDQAKRRLRETNERISDIAYSLGYEDANYFSRLFRRVVNSSAVDFRRRYRDWMS